jgi:hypothetical protein
VIGFWLRRQDSGSAVAAVDLASKEPITAWCLRFLRLRIDEKEMLRRQLEKPFRPEQLVEEIKLVLRD